MKTLLFIALIIIIVMIIRHKYQNYQSRKQESGTGGEAPRMVESMVRCKTCGLHIPEDEAIEQDGEFYCTRAHAPSRPRNPN
jgi:hypothetical protein